MQNHIYLPSRAEHAGRTHAATTRKRSSAWLAAATLVGLVGSAALTIPSAHAAPPPATSGSWLEASFNNIGIARAGAGLADFDGMGSYIVSSGESGDGLPLDTELTVPETTLKYSIAGSATGRADNIRIAGQTLNVAPALGAGATTAATSIAFIGASTFGGLGNQPVTITFDDSSQQTVNIGFSDWCDSNGHHDDIRLTPWNARYYSGSSQSIPCGLWATPTVVLTPTAPGAKIKTIKLPAANAGESKLHLFAIASDAVSNAAAISLKTTTHPVINAPTTYSASAVATATGLPTASSWTNGSGVATSDPVTLSYQWVAGDRVLQPASETYTDLPITSDLLNEAIQLRVIGTINGYISGSTSSNTVAVGPGSFSAVTPPSIPLAAQVGSSISVTPGTHSTADTSTSYKWFFANDTSGAGATLFASGNTLTVPVPANALGKVIYVETLTTKAGFNSLTEKSSYTSAVSAGTLTLSSAPSIAGSATAGQLLTVVPGVYPVTGVLEDYQWLADGAPIAGAVGSSYLVAANDVAKSITVRATASNVGYQTKVTVTNPVTAVADVFGQIMAPSTNGTPVVDGVLVASPGSYSVEGTTASYQWLRAGTAIPGATAANYTVSASDLGKQVSVRVTVSKSGFVSLTWTSPAVTATAGTIGVAVAPSAVLGKANATSAKISVGSTLSAKPGSYSAAGVSESYQWLRNGKAINGATKSTYKVTNADRLTQISVTVTISKPGYTTVSRTTAKSSAVKATTLKATSKPVIKVGSKLAAKAPVKVGGTLKTTAGKYNTTKVKVSYQWLRNGKAIKGAKKSSYKVSSKDRKKKISVRVTAKKTAYTTVMVTAKATKPVK